MAQAIPCYPCSVARENSTERLDILKLQYLDFGMEQAQAVLEKKFPPEELFTENIDVIVQTLKSKDPKSKSIKTWYYMCFSSNKLTKPQSKDRAVICR